MIKIRYTNAVDVGGIAYSSNFTPELYLDVDVGRPEYVYTEEGNETVDGSFERDFARVEKRYTVETHVQEYMLDALMLIQLHDYIEVYLSNGATIVVDEFRVSTPDWSDLDSLAKVTITFIVFNESVSGGCADDAIDCDGIGVPTIASSGTVTEGVIGAYATYVFSDGGEIIDVDELEAFYNSLGVESDPRIFSFTGSTSADTFYKVETYDTDGSYAAVNLVQTDYYLASVINSGVFTLNLYDYSNNAYRFKCIAYRHGCDEVDGAVTVLVILTPPI